MGSSVIMMMTDSSMSKIAIELYQLAIRYILAMHVGHYRLSILFTNI